MPNLPSDRLVGLVGAGLLGTAIAERLLAAGFDLTAHDRDTTRRPIVETLGAHWASAATELAHVARRIVLCLPDSHVIATVVDELRPHLRPGDLLVDTTTGDPDATVALAAELGQGGIGWIDACVLGSSEQLRRGEATLLVGGTAELIEAATDLLAALAAVRHHVGPPGFGQRMKLVANLVLGLNRAALAEGLHFAESQGLDPATALHILAAGPTYSRAMDTKGPRMIDRDYAPVARLSQHFKDVRLILEAAERSGTTLPFSMLHRELLERAESRGHGESDNAAIIEAWRTSTR